MDEILISSLIDKVDEQDKKIQALNEMMDQLPVYAELVNQFKTGFEGLRSDVRKISFPQEEMRELTVRLDTTIDLLKHPGTQKNIHHHYVPKIISIAAGLFLVLCLASMGWYGAYNKLEIYEANDTKYRYLKLEAGPGLNRSLHFIDSLYKTDSQMRESVIAKEEQNQRDLEIMQKAQQMEDEVRELKKKVKMKKSAEH